MSIPHCLGLLYVRGASSHGHMNRAVERLYTVCIGGGGAGVGGVTSKADYNY
jgi:hypothetical protein